MTDSGDSFSEIDAKLQDWSQGDCVLGTDHGFVFAFSPAVPLTEDAKKLAKDAGKDEIAYAESEVRGFMVLSQTCDLVRACIDRPFVEICPLTEVDDEKLQEIRKGRRPRYSWVPELAGQHLVADLDRVMTVEKAIVAGWDRHPGCTTDEHRRCLAQALVRKRARVAFPDDFTEWVGPLVKRLQEKHDKQSPEGRALQSLREIRLRAAPDWSAPEVEINFYFILEAGDPATKFEGKPWNEWKEDWMRPLNSDTKHFRANGMVTTLDDMIARAFIESDPFDLDHLSSRIRP